MNKQNEEDFIPKDIENMVTSDIKQEIEYMLKELKNRNINFILSGSPNR